MTEDPSATTPRRPATLLTAVVLAILEGLALVVHALIIAVSALNNPGSIAAAPVEIAIYLIFAAGIIACAWGMWRRRAAARTPFGVVQLFGLVIGWTLTQGDGDLVHWVGYVVLAASILGIALVLSPSLAASLDA